MVEPKVILDQRRILLIAPSFFGYEKRIADHLRSRGASVSYLNDRPSGSFLVRVLVRLKLPIIKPLTHRYFIRNFNKFKNNEFDDILIISPDAVNHQIVQELRLRHPSAKLRLYMWDSFENRKFRNIRAFLDLFDRVLTFDDQDAERYNMHFRPLFFSSQAKVLNERPPLAFSFIGTIHSDRFKILKQFIEQADRENLSYFVYPFLPSRAHYWAYRLFKQEFRHTSISSFQYRSMPYPAVLAKFDESLAIIDMEHPSQRGLTMRSLEVFGAGKKLLTSNPNIKHYSFYDPERIFVFDRKAPKLVQSFLASLPPHASAEDLQRFSLAGWIDEVFQ